MHFTVVAVGGTLYAYRCLYCLHFIYSPSLKIEAQAIAAHCEHCWPCMKEGAA